MAQPADLFASTMAPSSARLPMAVSGLQEWSDRGLYRHDLLSGCFSVLFGLAFQVL